MTQPPSTDAPAAYDGLASWYDNYIRSDKSGFTTRVQAMLAALAGSGPGRCLDLGCGTGVSIPTLHDLGWSVTGVDVSTDQLRVARETTGHLARDLVHASAEQLPFADDAFDLVAAVLMHTDVPDLSVVLAEARRVLRQGGVLAMVCVHPCFEGAHVSKHADGTRTIASGYATAGWIPGERFDSGGVRTHVGVHHLPLGELLSGAATAGFHLRQALEGAGDPPSLLGVRATAT